MELARLDPERHRRPLLLLAELTEARAVRYRTLRAGRQRGDILNGRRRDTVLRPRTGG